MGNVVSNYALAKWGRNMLQPLLNDGVYMALYNTAGIGGVGSIDSDTVLQRRASAKDITSGTSPTANTVECDSSFTRTVTLNSNTTVTDASCVSTDVGRPVSGTNVPAGAVITAVNAGVSFTISAAATGSGAITMTFGYYRVQLTGITVTIDNTNDWVTTSSNNVTFPALGGVTNHQISKAGVLYDHDTTTAPRTDSTGVTVTNGSATVADTSCIAGDVGKIVSGTGIPDASTSPNGAVPTILSVNAGVSFVMSLPATGAGTSVTIGGLATGATTHDKYVTPQSFHDLVVTPDGSDLVVTVSGLQKATH